MGEKTVCSPVFAERDLNYYLSLVRGDLAELEQVQILSVQASFSIKNVTVLVRAATMDRQYAELGEKLLAEFFQSLIRSLVKPQAVVLMGDAVKLACEQESFVRRLVVLEEQGVRIMVCMTSAEEFGVLDSLKVGFPVSMDEICNQLFNSVKVITL